MGRNLVRRRWIAFRARSVAIAVVCLVPLGVYAQEASVKPGINDNFRDPNPDSFISIFESESREIFHHRHDIVAALDLEEGLDVADVGAGTGFFSLMIAREVAPSGTVYAVDIAQKFLDHIQKSLADESITNVKTVLCTDRSTELEPESVDLVFVSDTYHHFEYPYDTLESIHKALRPDGVLVIIDFERVKGITAQWAYNHVRGGKGTVTDEVKDAGFELVEEVPMMEEQYFLKFKKRRSE